MKTLKLHKPLWSCKLSRTSFTDVKLTTLDGCGKVVVGHRVLLVSVSRKLAGLFNRQKEGVVMVRNVRFSHLETVIKFFYTGSVCVGGEGGFTEEDLQDVLNLLQVDKERLGEIEDSRDELQKLDIKNKDRGERFGGSECYIGNLLPEQDSDFTPIMMGRRMVDPRQNEKEEADSSELSNNNVSVAGSSKTIEEDIHPEDFRRNVDSKRVKQDDNMEEDIHLEDFRRKVDSKCVTQDHINIEEDIHPEGFRRNVDSKRVNKDDNKTAQVSLKKIKTSVRKKTNPRIYCTYCMQNVIYSEYRAHCRTFHPETPFDVGVRCEECPSVRTISQVCLQFHKRIFHPQGTEDNIKSTAKEIISDEEKVLGKSIMNCEFCDAEICFDKYFKHCRTRHQKVQWNERVECPACKNNKAEGIFMSRVCLPLHMKKHHGGQPREASEETNSVGLKKGGVSSMQLAATVHPSEMQRIKKEKN